MLLIRLYWVGCCFVGCFVLLDFFCIFFFYFCGRNEWFGETTNERRKHKLYSTLTTLASCWTQIIELSFCVSPPAMIAFVGWFVLCSTWICLSSHLNIIWWYLCKWIWWDIFSDSKQEMIPHNNKWCFCLFALFLYWGH